MSDAAHTPRRPRHSGVIDHLGASTFIEKGWTRISQEDYAGAIEVLQQALVLAPGDPQAASLLAWAQIQAGSTTVAASYLLGMLKDDPQCAIARVSLGLLCWREGRASVAADHLRAAVRASTDRRATLMAQLYLGALAVDAGHCDDAVAILEDVIAGAPNCIEAHFELGRARWQAGHTDAAIAAWDVASLRGKFSPWGRRAAVAADALRAGHAPEIRRW